MPSNVALFTAHNVRRGPWFVNRTLAQASGSGRRGLRVRSATARSHRRPAMSLARYDTGYAPDFAKALRRGKPDFAKALRRGKPDFAKVLRRGKPDFAKAPGRQAASRGGVMAATRPAAQYSGRIA
jgi:hypothetical protein